MSFNLRFDNPADGKNAWPHRKSRVAELIRKEKPDLLGIQEGLPHQVEFLAEKLPGYDWVGTGRDGGAGGEMSAVFYRKDRFEKVKDGTFWLSQTPEQVSQGWDAAHNRVATWSKLRDRRTGRELLYMNTHLDHKGKRAQRESASLLSDRVRSLAGNAPAILTGDFNATPESSPYRILGRRMKDARNASEKPHAGPDYTFAGVNGKFSFKAAADVTARIDHIFVSPGVKVLRTRTIDGDRRDPPSDHLPVVADIVPTE